MKREWKPGDVAMVSGKDGTVVRAIWQGDQWATKCATYLNDWQVTVRPLVVIDPDSDDDLDGICKALVEAMHKAGDRASAANGVHPATMRAALREFANPTPPRPDEPTGLGAVVEQDDEEWVHFGNGCWIKAVPNANLRQRAWHEFSSAVRVLSEGVQS